MSRAAPCPPSPPATAVDVHTLDRLLRPALERRSAYDIADGGRRAAVLLVLYDLAGEAHLLLTKRAAGLPSHPGQVSLPGGVNDPEDVSLLDTALRETEEEVGIGREGLRVIGRLDDVNTLATGFLVRPFVAWAPVAPTPVPAAGEVARVLQVPVAEILRIDAALPADPSLALMRYPLDGEDVWGATARILRTFAQLTRCALAGAPGLH